MTQYDFGTIDPDVTSGSDLADKIGQFRDAVLTQHSGNARPAYIKENQIWLDTSGSTRLWKFWDGNQDILLGTINPSDDTFSPAGVDPQAEVITTAVGVTLVAESNNKTVILTGAAATFAIAASTTLPTKWHTEVVARGGDITIDPSGVEVIDGATTLVIPKGTRATIYRSGSQFLTDKDQGFKNLTDAEKGQILSDLGAGILSGLRNKILNGGQDIWQRAGSQTGSGYGSDDRWDNSHVGTTKVHSIQSFPPGQIDVPGEPAYFSRTVVTSVAGANNFCSKIQRIEGVRTLAGRKATLRVYAKANAVRNIAVQIMQYFGSGGSPSPGVSVRVETLALTTSWKRFDIVVDLPSISGKTIGTANNDSLIVRFWFDAGTTYNSETNNLGQQSGTFDLSRISLVEGDASKEFDCFSPRHIQQEIALCQRYYEMGYSGLDIYEIAGGNSRHNVNFKVVKRAVPSISQSDAGSVNFTTVNIGTDVTTMGFNSGRIKDGATGKGAWTNFWQVDAEM